VLLTDESGRRRIAPAIRFRHEPATRPVLREPLLGEHTAETLARSGLGEPDVLIAASGAATARKRLGQSTRVHFPPSFVPDQCSPASTQAAA
jgi:hypothetical protein